MWAFLRDGLPPFASLAPARTVLVDSLSKRLAPGLTLGFAVAPPSMADALAATVRSGSWSPMRFPLEAVTRWITDGVVDTVVRAKQQQAAERQQTAARELAGFTVRADPRSYYCWWELPHPWRADAFVAAAAREGIAVSPGCDFAVARHSAPAAVRLGLASPTPETLTRALTTLTALARRRPDEIAAG